MNRLFSVVLVMGLIAIPGGVDAATPRTYLEFSGGINVLNTNLDGDVVNERILGQVELGIGTHLTDNLLLEASFGRLGTMQQQPPIFPLTPDELQMRLSVSERAYRVEVNPMMLRLRYAQSGLRTGYIKPEFSGGLGLYSVTRWLRNALEPEQKSDLVPVVEIGMSMLVVFNKNWMGYVGPRYTLMQRRDLADDTEHLDGVSVLLGFRFFLNSPRDEYEPVDE